MSKENFEQFMKQVADSEDLQAKIGEEITGEALVALGAAHGCEFSIEDVQAGAELSDKELERVAGGYPDDGTVVRIADASKLRLRCGSKGLAMQGGRVIFESVSAGYGEAVTDTSGGT